MIPGNNKRIILASASPRRRELLSLITDDFEIITKEVDERKAEIDMEENGTPALRVSEGLALLKAKAVFDELPGEEKKNVLVIGADTSVVLDDVIFGKRRIHADETVRKKARCRNRSGAHHGRKNEMLYRRDAGRIL